MIERNRCIGCAALILLTACASAPTITSVNPSQLTQEQAVLVLSTGADDTCTLNASYLMLKESSKSPTLLRGEKAFDFNNRWVSSDFPGEHAKLYTVVVKPGRYDPWVNSVNPHLTYESPLVTEPFDLPPGAITYIGEFRSMGCAEFLRIRHSNLHRERDFEKLREVSAGVDVNSIRLMYPTMKD